MLTLTLTNRNRELRIIENCLQSLKNQSNQSFNVILVDYGSEHTYLKLLSDLLSKYDFLKLILCKAQGQLWNKSRAINIALKQTTTPYFFVGDIDMIYHPNFVEKLYHYNEKDISVYFQVGFLSELESKQNKAFNDYQISFKSNEEATGMTLFNAEALKFINGYDEFYNGWGSEDTDVHLRLKNAEQNVVFYSDDILILHQWHPKIYRNKSSLAPFHSYLEKINQKYLHYTRESGKVLANSKFEWGKYNVNDYLSLEKPEIELMSTNELADLKGLMNNIFLSFKGRVVFISIKRHKDYKSMYFFVKKMLGKKVKVFISMQDVNNLILENIIVNYRNSAYNYSFDSNSQEIKLVIKL